MPKPTLIQSVFRKPTRSYASPNHRNPYADHDEDEDYLYGSYRPSSRASTSRPPSRYTSHVDRGVHLGYTEVGNPRYAEHEPSRQASKRRSTITGAQTPVNDLSAGTRFPKPVKQSQRSAGVSPGVNGWIENGQTEVTRSGTIVRKKKQNAIQTNGEEASSVVSDGLARTPTARRANQSAPSTLVHPKSSSVARTPSKTSKGTKATQQLVPPPQIPIQPRPPLPVVTEAPASPPRLPPRKVKPKQKQTTTQDVQSVVAPPLTPPISEKSISSKHRAEVEPEYSPAASSEASVPPPSRPRKSPKRKSFGEDILDDENDIFYTPRTSAEPNSARSTMVEPPTSAMLVAPQMVFQPPTPAAMEEADESPFHSEQSSSLSSSLHPQDGVSSSQMTLRGKRQSIRSPTPKSRHVNGRSQEEAEHVEDENAESDVGDIASEDEQDEDRSEKRRVSPSGSNRSFSKHSRGDAPRSRPPSVGQSASSGNIHRPKSRGSVKSSKTYDDFKIPNRDFYAARSEASYGGGRSAREGSIKSTTSGYGKGGWAAAAASRSGAASPVMYLPSGANDGWADFQPPPRQSKFTPLPPASQPQTFDKLVLGIPDNEAYEQQGEEGSYESSYDSSDEEDPDMPKPSRSYARPDGHSPPSHTPGSSNGGQTPPEQYQQNASRRKPVPAGSEGGYNLGRSLPSEPDSVEWHEETLQRFSRISSPPPPLPLGLPGERIISAPARNSSLDDSSLSRIPPRPLSRRSQTAPEPSSPPFDDRPQLPHYPSDRPMSPVSNYNYEDPPRPRSRVGFSAPSTMDPDTITLLPEMTAEDSARTYEPAESLRPPSRQSRRDNGNGNDVMRSASVFSGASRASKSDFEDYEDEKADVLGELPPIRRAKSALSFRKTSSNGGGDNGIGSSDWEGSSAGEGVLMESHGRDADTLGGYT